MNEVLLHYKVNLIWIFMEFICNVKGDNEVIKNGIFDKVDFKLLPIININMVLVHV